MARDMDGVRLPRGRKFHSVKHPRLPGHHFPSSPLLSAVVPSFVYYFPLAAPPPPPHAFARTIVLYGMGPISICVKVEGSPPPLQPFHSPSASESVSWPMMSSGKGISSMTHRRHTDVACGLDSCVPELLLRGQY
jgi:hypothetical protein